MSTLITIPFGSAHLPHDRIAAPRSLSSTAVGAASYVEEALRWSLEGETGAPPAAPVVPERERTACILLADDNADAAELLATSVRMTGHVVEVAHDGPEALAIGERFRPDVALLDIGLPVMDGYELASHLRALPGLSSLRLIAVTGYSQEADRRQAAAAGFEHYLVKPIQIAQFHAALASS